MTAAMTFTEFGSLVALVIGWIVVFCLWWFVFRTGGE